jgi:hypothetical protein
MEMLGKSLKNAISYFQSQDHATKIMARRTYLKDIRTKHILQWLTTGVVSIVWNREKQCTFFYLSPDQRHLGIEVGHCLPDGSGIIGFPQHPDPRVQQMFEKLTAFFMTFFREKGINLKKSADFMGCAELRRTFNQFAYTAYKTL